MKLAARPTPSGRRRDSRGAALVEYALLVVLFVLASTAAISQLTKASGSKLSKVSGNVGVLPSVPGLGSTTIYPTTAAPTTVAATTESVTLSGASFTGGSSWTVSVVATVKDNLGNPVSGATVTVTADIKNSSGTILTTKPGLTGTTNASGVATISQSGTNTGAAKVTFTVTSVTNVGSLTWDSVKPSASTP